MQKADDNKEIPTPEVVMTEPVSEDYALIRKTRKRIIWHRAASGIVFGLYFILLYLFTATLEHAVELAMIQIVPLAAVWFGDAMAAMIDVDLDRRFSLGVTTASPGAIIRIAGWLFLILPVAGFILGRINSR